MNEPADQTTPMELPSGLEQAWGRQSRVRRGPKPALTLEQLVAAGIQVAQSEGIAALSMARVATELGSSTMALYRYVKAKDDLLLLMVDSALGPPPPIQPGTDWRAGLTQWATVLRGRYRANTWSLRVPISGPPLGPNNVAWLDNALAAQAETTLSEQDKLSAVLLLSGFVRNEATLTADFAEHASGPAEGDVMPGYGAMLKTLIDPRDFPALHRAIESGSLDDPDDPDIEFDFGLARILDGLQLLMEVADE